MKKRWPAMLRTLLPVLLWAAGTCGAAAPIAYPEVAPGYTLVFPRDFGAHPDYRTEWWYVTGWLTTDQGKPLGFQVTFFRSRPNVDDTNPSAFAPHQLLFAHAALADPTLGRLMHDQRAARAGFGLAGAREADTEIWIDDWRFTRASGTYEAQLAGRNFALRLSLTATQPALLQGERGYSRKGPKPTQASHYYSEPQLAVSGVITRAGKEERVQGTAWLDHEWSTAYLADGAVGWDWTAINLNDGGALMLFRMRDQAGGQVWAGGTRRRADGSTTRFEADAISFVPLRRWRSPRTNAEYPVAMRVQTRDLAFELRPLMDDQELDSRASTGTVYWEGAVDAITETGERIGRGYLELTGYWKPLHF